MVSSSSGPNPRTQPLDRRAAASPSPAGLREAPFCSQILLDSPRASFSSLAFKMPLPPFLPSQPQGCGWVAHPREMLQAEKVAWWENPGSVVLIPVPTPHTGIFCTSLLDCAPDPKVISFLFLFGWCSRRRVCMGPHL